MGASAGATRGWGTAKTKAPALGWEGGRRKALESRVSRSKAPGKKRKAGAPREVFGFPDDLGLSH